jgi:tRNA (adenine37-N6)-methyltransferase
MMIDVEPIGVVRCSRREPDDDAWDAETASIELDPRRFTADALLGLDQFSHVEIIYWFHHPDAAEPNLGARHPRGRADWPRVGIFAQRAKNRPNRLGLTIARIVSVDALTLKVSGLDAIDGTPVLDLKPWMSGFGPRGSIREPSWSTELMSGYWE